MGQFSRAVAEWKDTEAMAKRAMATKPQSYYPLRHMIPVYQNWAMELARRSDRKGALEIAGRAEEFARELSTRDALYARAPAWPPRVRAWKAHFCDTLGDKQCAATAREESLGMWKAVSSRANLPEDVLK